MSWLSSIIIIQCDKVIEARRPDIVIVDHRERTCNILDIAVPNDNRVCMKEQEEVEKYQELRWEISRMWNMKKVTVIPMVIGALGTVSKRIQSWIKKIGVEVRTEQLQKTALLGTARILRKVLDAWYWKKGISRAPLVICYYPHPQYMYTLAQHLPAWNNIIIIIIITKNNDKN